MKCGFFPILYSSLAFNFVIYFSSKTFFALIKAGSDHSEKKILTIAVMKKDQLYSAVLLRNVN
jgi:hypothetical protein